MKMNAALEFLEKFIHTLSETMDVTVMPSSTDLSSVFYP